MGCSEAGGRLQAARLLDPVRLDASLWLFGVFVLALLLYAGWTGAKAMVSFAFTVVVIWKLLLPGFLTMLMLMMAKGIHLEPILNMNHVAAEILKTLSGTIGLTLAAPLTAVICGLILVPLPLGDRKPAPTRRPVPAEP
jgi:uncharacterized membrane protein